MSLLLQYQVGKAVPLWREATDHSITAVHPKIQNPNSSGRRVTHVFFSLQPRPTQQQRQQPFLAPRTSNLHQPPASQTMRPAAAAFTAFLSRRSSSCTSSSGILSPHASSVTSCARFAFGGSRRNMTVYSFSHRNSLARGALSVSSANSNANSSGGADVSNGRGSGSGATGPSSKIPRTPQKKRAFSSTSLSASSSRTCSTRGTDRKSVV